MTAADENVTENVKAPLFLKVLVVVLGLAIVGMLGLIIVKVIAGDHKKATPVQRNNVAGDVSVAAPPHAGKAGAEFLSAIEVARPEGATLLSYQIEGSEIVLHFKRSDGSDALFMVNRVDGKISRILIP